ncbi:TonB system transport protein ExbD [Alphaproteobacteria bacterium]|nr:TonB system transport protein ExbD [Alphaproteobacteria bacterium]
MTLRSPFEDEGGEMHEINVTPFIDVVLVLLIIFMVAAPLATVDVNVDLPTSSAVQRQRPDQPLYLTIAADGGIAVGDDIVAWDELGASIDRAAEGDREKRIFLRADKSTEYGRLMEVMDCLRKSGYLKIALVTLEGAK